MDFDTPDQVAALFAAAGGPTKLAHRLGFSRQRCTHWFRNSRIPPMVARAYRQQFRRIVGTK